MIKPMLRLQKFNDLSELTGALHLALGVFDGVHMGHRAVISTAQQAAARDGGSCGVVTFDPHPIRLLAPDRAPKQLLASLDHKARLLDEIGVDFLLALSFTRVLAALDAEIFVEQMVATGQVKSISVGEDWRFGNGRKGDVSLLRAMGERHGFAVNALPPVMHQGERISSTRIRQSIRDGAMANAAEMLGRPYGIEGIVVKGQELGRTLGFPTANVAFGEEQLPPDGVWAVRGRLGHVAWTGVANLGCRPTVNGTARVLEVHLFDHQEDLYGKLLEVEFVKSLRDEKKFASIDELRHQISLDAIAARDFFSHSSL
jgi:riboflavin kinase/FMN adenylyltransferase